MRATTPSPEGGFQTDLDDLLVLVGLLTPAAAVILLVILDVLPGLAVLIAAVLTLAAIGRAVL